MGVVFFWGALIYAVGWGLVSYLANVPHAYEVAIGSFSITVNRWFDVFLFPLYLNLILSVYLWLFPVLKKYRADYEDLVAGFVTGLVLGLIAGLALGLIAGFGAGFVTGPIAGLALGLITVLVALISLIIKAVVDMHKRTFKKLSD
ncbi:MAG: hypothetical protein HYY55_02685 [Candidatus Niyogibacteria bacterium]|nr:MAG: hypothetical protein HYY55_02685 [Candidatus Niyogibacteria bacterium]